MPLADFEYVEFLVSNASQSAYWYCSCFGFERFAQKQTNNGCSIAVRNGKTIFLLTSFTNFPPNMEERLRNHGDAVCNIGFRVDDIHAITERLIEKKVKIIEELSKEQDDNGHIVSVKIQACETDLLHTLIDRSNYFGTFLPGYKLIENFPLFSSLKDIPIRMTDHVVQNYPIDTIPDVEEWYLNSLNLQRFWSIDDQIRQKEDSAIKAHLLTNEERLVQMTLVESMKHNPTDQISEFLKFNGGSGVQHIALLVDDIISSIEMMKQRSVEFLVVPSTYYDMLEERLKVSKVEVEEDLNKLRELNILIDFDDNGYLLQIFTKPCQDRPTLFFELIQRHNFDGFGAGNVKALFDAVEREQELRRAAALM